MGWLILVVVLYLPVFYRLQRRIGHLEKQVTDLQQQLVNQNVVHMPRGDI